MTVLRSGTGDSPANLIQAGEKWLALTPRSGAAGRLVIVGFGQQNATPYLRLKDLKALADSGLVVVCADLGGDTLWSNDTQLTRVDEIIAFAAARFGAVTDKVSWVGDSRFACLALNWAWRHPSQVGALALRIPVVALDAFHDRNALGLATEIETAYGGLAAYNAALPTHDPSHANQVPLIGAIKDRVRCFYSTDDPAVLPADVTTFQALTGVSVRPLGAVGHNPWAAPTIHAQHQAEWIWSKLP